MFYALSTKKNDAELNQRHVILVEKDARKGENQLMGRTDTNKKVIIPKEEIPTSLESDSGDRVVPRPGTLKYSYSLYQ